MTPKETLALSIAALTVLMAAACGKPAAPSTSVSAVQGVRRVLFSPSDRRQIEELAIGLVEVCNVEAPDTIAYEGRLDAVRLGPHVRIAFDPPRTLRVPAKSAAGEEDVIAADEIVISMSAYSNPGTIWVRSGDSIHGFSEYSPYPWHESWRRIHSIELSTPYDPSSSFNRQWFEIQTILKTAMDRKEPDNRRPIG